MKFNLTPSHVVETQEDVDAALAEIESFGADEAWIATLRTRAENFMSETVEFTIEDAEEICASAAPEPTQAELTAMLKEASLRKKTT